jgi:hypothetical protein
VILGVFGAEVYSIEESLATCMEEDKVEIEAKLRRGA